MLSDLNQYLPSSSQGAADDPIVYKKLLQLTSPVPVNQR